MSTGIEARENRTGLLFVSPVLFWYTIFFWFPLGFVIYLSFTEWNLFNAPEFIGWQNYIDMIADPYFIKSLTISLTYAVSTTFLLLVTGMFFAILLDRSGFIPEVGRSLIFMTAIIPMIPAGAIWVWITGPEPYSLMNTIMNFLGLPLLKWIKSPSLALPCVIGFTVWKRTGFNALIYTAGLRGLSNTYYEAARIDGASAWQMIRHITIPLLKPISLFLLVTNMIQGWNVFGPVWFLTKGGPGTATRVLSTYVYHNGFQRMNYGFASASAIVLILIVGTISYIEMKVGQE